MTILMVTRGFPSKLYPLNGIFEWDQAKALREQGHKVIYLALDMRSFRRKRKLGLRVFQEQGIDVYDCNFPLGAVGHGLLNYFSWRMFCRVYGKIVKAQGKPDILHAHFARATGYVAYRAHKKFDLQYVLTEHDSSINQDTISASEKKLLKKIYHAAACRIAVSENFKERLQSLYEEKFIYIPNIVDLSAMNCVNKVPHKGFTFVSVGALSEWKGMDKTIEGFAVLHSRYPETRLVIIGDGEDRESLLRLVENLKLQECVTLTGRLERIKIKEYFDRSDCFVLMSKSETFGVVYIEAMAAGLPVIATRCGGPESFVDDGNGILVDVDDVGQLVCAMETMLSRQYDAQALRKFCLDRFSPEVVARKITELIEDNAAIKDNKSATI